MLNLFKISQLEKSLGSERSLRETVDKFMKIIELSDPKTLSNKRTASILFYAFKKFEERITGKEEKIVNDILPILDRRHVHLLNARANILVNAIINSQDNDRIFNAAYDMVNSIPDDIYCEQDPYALDAYENAFNAYGLMITSL